MFDNCNYLAQDNLAVRKQVDIVNSVWLHSCPCLSVTEIHIISSNMQV